MGLGRVGGMGSRVGGMRRGGKEGDGFGFKGCADGGNRTTL